MLASSPSRLEEREGRALPGEQGKLLDNMLKAINKRNAEKDKLFPIRGFIMPVESFTAPVGEM